MNHYCLLFWTTSLFAEAFVFVHLGPTPPPYLQAAISQTHLFNKTTPLYLVISEEAIPQLPKNLPVIIIAAESLPKSPSHNQFDRETPHRGFWRYAIERFFYLEECIRHHNLSDVFHMENDIMIYFDVKQALPLFHTLYTSMIGAVFDNDGRCIPSFVYIPSAPSLTKFVVFVAQRATAQTFDMELLAQFKNAYHKKYIDFLPLVPPTYAADYELRTRSGKGVHDPAPYSNHFDAFQSIFDAAAWGQYIGGDDPMHHHGPGFINESCVFNPALFRFEWRQDEEGRQIPFISYRGESWRINNLHAHCKNLTLFSSENRVMPSVPEPIDSTLEKIAFAPTNDPLDVVIIGDPSPFIDELQKAGVRRIVAITPAPTLSAVEWFKESDFPFSIPSILSEMFLPTERGDSIRLQYRPRSPLPHLYRQLLKLYAPIVIPGLSENVLVLDTYPFSLEEPKPLPFYSEAHFTFALRLIFPFASLSHNYTALQGSPVFRKSIVADLLQILSQYHHTEGWRAISRVARQSDLSQSIFSADELYYNYYKLRSL